MPIFRDNPNQEIPPEITRDAELAQAIAAHVAANDPHTRYLLERTLPLLSHALLGATPGIPDASTVPFNANTWNPNAGQAHASAVNIAAIGMGGAAGNVNLPVSSYPGLIIEIDPFLGTPWAGTGKTQFFAYFSSLPNFPPSLYMRQSILGSFSWHPWQQIALNGVFATGISIGGGSSTLKRIISKEFTIDPPAIVGGAPWPPQIFPLAGAVVGDFCQVSITTPDLWNTGLWIAELQATVTSADQIAIHLRNDWTGTLDWGPFKVRVVVMSFS